MNNNSIDIEAAMTLLKKRSTSVDDICKFIYKDIAVYQDARENFYFEEFKNEFSYKKNVSFEDIANEHAELIVQKIEKDVKAFTTKYIDNSIDGVLDAINENRIKSKKKAETLLVLLSSFKRINEEI